MEDVLGQMLKEKAGQLPLVGDIRGRGLFWAIEFMLDGHRRIPLPKEARFCDRIVNRALELGLNILGNLGATGEVYVDHIIICPPYVITEEEMKDAVAIMVRAITDVSDELFPGLTPSKPRLNGFKSNAVNGH